MIENFSGVHLIVLLAVVALIAGIVAAAVTTVKDPTMPRVEKAIWLAAFIFLPYAGLAAWGLSRLVRRRINPLQAQG